MHNVISYASLSLSLLSLFIFFHSIDSVCVCVTRFRVTVAYAHMKGVTIPSGPEMMMLKKKLCEKKLKHCNGTNTILSTISNDICVSTVANANHISCELVYYLSCMFTAHIIINSSTSNNKIGFMQTIQMVNVYLMSMFVICEIRCIAHTHTHMRHWHIRWTSHVFPEMAHQMKITIRFFLFSLSLSPKYTCGKLYDSAKLRSRTRCFYILFIFGNM